MNKHNIRTIFKPPRKIEQILRNPKDQRPPLISAKEVYKILRPCEKVYISETGRMINMKEHQWAVHVRLEHVTQSALVEHNVETAHQILFDKMATRVTTMSYFSRKYRETLKIQKHPEN